MSYPGPPGVSKPSHPSHPSLPPRPPVAKLPGFKPAFPPAAAASTATSAPGYTASAPSYHGYGPSAGPAGYGGPPTASPYVGSPPAPAIGAGRGGYGSAGAYSYTAQQTYAPQQPAYYGAAATSSYSTPPQIRNPFPAPDSAGSDYDPEMAAQIAQWQSAYMPKDPNDQGTKAASATGSRAGTATPAAAAQASTTEAVDSTANGDANEKKKTVYREGGGKKWQDDTLLEWDPAHLRLFVGNLAGETTDDSLLKAFARWKSVQRAKVIRDKRTTKSKGFGFVSFSDPEDFFQAAKEMNGKYIQSHPVVVRKAKTEIKPQALKEDRKSKNKPKSGSGLGTGVGADGVAAYQPHLGPMAGAGITKPGQKTKGGLKLLG